MASHESIRPEASTVHRVSPPAAPEDQTATGLRPDVRLAGDDEQLVQAKTVIRGSSRPRHQGDGANQVERSPASVAQVLLGTHLNHFLLEELIGGGGMGAVFRARDEQLDRVVAVKVIPFVGDDPELQRRFRNEAQSAAKLDHPRIARVFDVGSHGQWHYIVFEYIRGTNVRDMVLAGGVLSIDDAVFYTCQLAEAIQHAADRGIVHRDIKPSNVLIGEEDKIKLVDMGLARSDNFELSEDMTASGVTLGTFDYISPEQARDPRDADLRSDIYSLGCTLYFMLTGSPPYPGGTMLQKLLSHGNAPPPDVRQARDEVSDELNAVIQKMLAKSPDDRYQSANDLIADLREVAFRDSLHRAQAVGPVPLAQPNPMMIWLERHAPWLAAVSLLLLIAGWMHLDSVVLQDPVNVPKSAGRPLLVSTTTQPAVSPSEAPSAGGDSQSGDPTTGPSISPQPPDFSGREPQLSDGPLDDVQTAGDREFVGPIAMPVDSAAITGRQDSDRVERNSGDSTLATETDDPAGASNQFVPPAKIRVIGSQVADQDQVEGERAMLTTSLAEAIQLARQYEVDLVEIATPVVVSRPLEIRRDNLRISSVVAGGSVVVFEQDLSQELATSHSLTIGSNRIEMEDLHFYWRVPEGQIGGGALLGVNENPLVKMTDCSITIDNPNQYKFVYAFDVVTDPNLAPQREVDSPRREENPLPLVAIELNNVIIRGQIGMIHMDRAAELQLNWDNGLLAISEQMIDTAGARVAPSPASRPIQLWLTRLTAHAPKGLFRMRMDGDDSHPVPVDRFARSSVFKVDPGVPLFEFSGLEPTANPPELLELRGTANAYDADPTLDEPVMIAWANEADAEITCYIDLLSRWPDEVSPRWSVYWSQVRLSDALPSQRRPADYRQDGSVRSGFDEKLLPILPDWDVSQAADSSDLPLTGGNNAAREL